MGLVRLLDLNICRGELRSWPALLHPRTTTRVIRTPRATPNLDRVLKSVHGEREKCPAALLCQYWHKRAAGEQSCGLLTPILAQESSRGAVLRPSYVNIDVRRPQWSCQSSMGAVLRPSYVNIDVRRKQGSSPAAFLRQY